ncbi:MAG: hypothetical protein ACK4ON_04065, partial [Bacteroidia bacterium]
RKKGGLKVHMLIDAVQSVGRFIKITEAKVHDKNLLNPNYAIDNGVSCKAIYISVLTADLLEQPIGLLQLH